jgi:hypothetical protein
MRDSAWVRWTNAEVEYLREHAGDSNEIIAAALGRDISAVRRKRYALCLKLSADRKLAIRRAATKRRKDIWPAAPKKVLEDHGWRFFGTFGRECDQLLKPLIDAAGPPRSLQAIQLMRSNLGITETKDARKRRLRQAARSINYEKRRQIPSSLTWEDLSPLARAVLLGSLLGDSGI